MFDSIIDMTPQGLGINSSSGYSISLKSPSFIGISFGGTRVCNGLNSNTIYKWLF